MLIVRDHADLAAAARSRGRVSGLGGWFVPTMGALHAGHGALIRRASELAAEAGHPGAGIVSIFVNPTQFNDQADFDRYPKTLDADLAICRDAGAGAVFVPSVATMYPDTSSAPVPPLPRVATDPGLEDRFRPGHFAGVCQVVLRLFRLVEPQAAIFGEKDWQQLQVITAMAREWSPEVRIISHETLRDPDGIAMSSRNRFLLLSERNAALSIPRALARAGDTANSAHAESLMREELHNSAIQVEYAVIRDGATLGPIEGRAAAGRALIAARVGSTRLIDNAPWPAQRTGST
jgi:pantoate--beta-alanine ligase